jgi:hypothetical protein
MACAGEISGLTTVSLCLYGNAFAVDPSFPSLLSANLVDIVSILSSHQSRQDFNSVAVLEFCDGLGTEAAPSVVVRWQECASLIQSCIVPADVCVDGCGSRTLLYRLYPG